jgi:beta-carotene hydroxylase
MSRDIVCLNDLTAEQKREFKRLTSAPDAAWPTLILFVVLLSTYLSVYALAGAGLMPLWIGTALNAVVGYVSFSVAHDGIHRAISKSTRLNDAIGQLGLTIVLPYVDMRLFRWAHIQHHRFTNDPRDPDKYFKGSWWSLPIRWMMIDAVYFVHSIRHGDKVSSPAFRASLVRGAILLAILSVLAWAGYGLEIFMLWFLPSRLILLVLGFSFFWLPHVPHDISQIENFTRATTVRQGHEWLLGPIMQYQNYHLIHHLYPMTPFYNNAKVFKLIERQLQSKDLSVQHGFDIYPTIHPGRPQGV